MSTVKLGSLGSQALKVMVYRADGKSSTSICVPMLQRQKLMPEINLEQARQAMATSIAEFVPSRTTADGWIQEFELFHPAGVLAERWADFCALVYLRTRLKKADLGFLEVSSCATYLRYVTQKYKALASAPCFRAIETEAGSVGPKHKAAAAGAQLVARVVRFFHDSSKPFVERAGAWMQTTTGARPIDVSQLCGGGATFEPSRLVSVDWRWTKSIKKPKDAKSVDMPPGIAAIVGPPPFSPAKWRKLSGDGSVRPLKEYSSSSINPFLKELSSGFTEKITSATLRDVYHQHLKEFCGGDEVMMARYTVHRSGKSLRSSYMTATRKKAEPGPRAKKAPAKKAPATVAKKKKR
jgi:hypothetical protein